MNVNLNERMQPNEADEDVSNVVGTEARRLAVHSVQYLGGLIGGLVLGLISFPIFTRLFSVAEYGLLDLAQKLVLLLTVVAKAGLQNAAVRFHNRNEFKVNRHAERAYFSTMVFGVSVNSIVVDFLFLGGIFLVSRYFDAGMIGTFAYLVAALAMLRAVGSVLMAFLRVEERTLAFNILTIGLRAVTIAVIWTWAFITGATAKGYLLSVILSELALIAGLCLWLRNRGVLSAGTFDTNLYKAGVAFGVPLVLYEFGFVALGSADRILVQTYLGAEALGVYSVAYGLSQHANDLLLGPLTLALSPIYLKLWMTKGATETSHFLSVSLDAFLGGAMCVLAVATVTARDLVVILASGKYLGADELIPWLLAGLLLFATHLFLVAGLIIHQKTLLMAGILASSAVFNIALNCFLLPLMGLRGGAVATVASYLLCVLMLARASRRHLPLEIRWWSLARYVASAAFAFVAGWSVVSASSMFSFVSKSATTFLVYVGILYLLDVRVRQLASKGWHLASQFATRMD